MNENLLTVDLPVNKSILDLEFDENVERERDGNASETPGRGQNQELNDAEEIGIYSLREEDALLAIDDDTGSTFEGTWLYVPTFLRSPRAKRVTELRCGQTAC